MLEIVKRLTRVRLDVVEIYPVFSKTDLILELEEVKDMQKSMLNLIFIAEK